MLLTNKTDLIDKYTRQITNRKLLLFPLTIIKWQKIVNKIIFTLDEPTIKIIGKSGIRAKIESHLLIIIIVINMIAKNCEISNIDSLAYESYLCEKCSKLAKIKYISKDIKIIEKNIFRTANKLREYLRALIKYRDGKYKIACK